MLVRWDAFFDGATGEAAGHSPGNGLSALPLAAAGPLRFPGDTRCWAIECAVDTGIDRAILGYDLYFTPLPEPEDDPDSEPASVLDDAQRAHLFGGAFGQALRQPIGRIIANAESINGRLEGPLRADYAGYASDIADAARHLLALVEDLTDLEAIEGQGFSAIDEPIDLADLARRAAGLLAIRASDKRIRVDAPAEDEALPARGEFRRVLQILLNLIGNAISYTPEGSMIWIRLDEDDGRACVTVADQGPGIDADEQARLFRKWERLGRSGDGGSGLGLYISKRLAEAMRGDLSVDSAPGQGARFTLTLPAG